MGGQEGNRGYLVQAIIALLQAVEDDKWTKVTVEPDAGAEKVDILFQGSTTKALQVKSSQNQIAKADAEKWATDLKGNFTADDYELILVGPCAQSVAEMQTHNGVSIPCPKSLDLDGLLAQAAHLLEKFLVKQGLNPQSAVQREIMVRALTTEMSVYSCGGKPLTRQSLVDLLKSWMSSITGSDSSSWESVRFIHQRNIEHAIAGQRLGPADVEACPELTVCADISSELGRQHIYQIVGTPGCGKSITAWQVAKRFHDAGTNVLRPRAMSRENDLLANIPDYGPSLLVVDDSHRFSAVLAERLSECASRTTRVLLISTVDDPRLAGTFCISPQQSVRELQSALLARRDEILPLVQVHDDRVGDRYMDISFESRLNECARQPTPWAFFWVLRGGWQTARKEYEHLKQFAHANDLIAAIAIGQILTCDAGVSYEWIVAMATRLGMDAGAVDKVLRQLCELKLVLVADVIRTKHITYAHRLLEEGLDHTNAVAWPNQIAMILHAIQDPASSLKGINWLLNAIGNTDAMRLKSASAFQPLVEPLIDRCINASDDIDWAAACFSSVFWRFDVPMSDILKHKEVILRWCTSGCGLVAYFCSNILNHLINESNKESRDQNRSGSENVARDLINAIDVPLLINQFKSVQVEQFHTAGTLLNRLAYYGPAWAQEFLAKFDWPRIRKLILDNTDADDSYAVDELAASISRLAERESPEAGLKYIDEIRPYIVKVFAKHPCSAIPAMDDVFWRYLGYTPKFLRGGDSPNEGQTRVAKAIVNDLDPRWFADAIGIATSRDLENLARSFAVIWEVDRDFLPRVASHISEEYFYAATRADWQEQSDELEHLIRFFCFGENRGPARKWIQDNQTEIEGPLSPFFTAIAPNVAIEWFRSGKAVLLVNSRARWLETDMAILAVASLDKEVAAALVEQQLDALVQQLFHLSLDGAKPMLMLFRAVHEVSPKLFDDLVDRLDLDNSEAVKTIQQLRRQQPSEREEYKKLARVGRRLGGKVSDLAGDFLSRLEAASADEAPQS